MKLLMRDGTEYNIEEWLNQIKVLAYHETCYEESRVIDI